MKKNIIIIVLAVSLLGASGFIVYDKVVEKDQKANENKNVIEEKNDEKETVNEENESLENEKIEEITLPDLSSMIKEYYKNNPYNSNGELLYSENEVLLSNITEVSYLGYYKSNESIKYYELKGIYKCKNNKDNCVYMSQIDDIHDYGIDYKAVIAIKRVGESFALDHIDSETLRSQIENDPEMKNNFEYVNTTVN